MKPEKSINDHAATVEIEGIEIFEPDIMPDSTGQLPDNDRQEEYIPISEAVVRLGISERTIRRRVKAGKLAKKKDDDGKTLVLCPAPTDTTPDSDRRAPDTPSQQPDNDRLWDLVREQAAKLEAASYRNGFLENELESYQEKVKLLPDLQSQAEKAAEQEGELLEIKAEMLKIKSSWWYRFWKWFTESR